MAARTSNPEALFAKKILAMVLLVVGLALAAAGFYYANMLMTVIGVLALLAAVILLVRKIISRNERL